jgi:hypothetical protein
VLAEVAGMVPGVAHVELDAEHSLDLVRRLGHRQTPTTIVLDATVGRSCARKGSRVPRTSWRRSATRYRDAVLMWIPVALVKRRAVDLCRLGSSLCPSA